MRVYVSSTSVDLSEHRAAVIAAILRLGHSPVAMEFYTAESVKPVHRCLDDVAGCDLYVGIFANRYGHIPEGYDRSISELEYRRAAAEGVPTLIFLLDESATWPEELVDGGQAREKLVALKEELKATTLVSFFKSPDDLSARVTAAIATTRTATLHTGVVGIRPADVADRFKDREGALLEITRLLDERALKLICIVGRGGVGKTWLLSKVCHEIESGDLRLSRAATRMGVDGIVYLDCRPQGQGLAEAIFRGLSQLISRPLSRELQREWNDVSLPMAEKVRRLLSALREGCYLVVLDNFEKALGEDNTIADERLRTFVEVCLATPHALRLLATTREEVFVPSAMGAARAVVVGGLPEGDAVALLKELDPGGEIGLRDAPDEQLLEAARRCFCVPRAVENLAGILLADRSLSLSQLLADAAIFTEKVVENLIGEHFRRLPWAEQRVLEALAVLDAPSPLAAVESMVAPLLPPAETRASLSRLVKRLFVVRATVPAETEGANCPDGDRPRRDVQYHYYLHPMDQQFAYAQMPTRRFTIARVAGRRGMTRAQAHERAAKYFDLTTRSRELWTARRDLDAPISAFRHAVLAGLYGRACRALEQFAFTHLWLWGYCDETVTLHEMLNGRLTHPRLRSVHAINLAFAYWSAGRLDEAIATCRKALRLPVLMGNPWALSRLWGNTGLVCITTGEIGSGKRYLSRAALLAGVLGDAETRAISLCDRAVLCRMEGEMEESMRLARRGVDLAARAKTGRVGSNLWANIGQCQFMCGELLSARSSFRTGLSMAREAQSAAGLYYNLRGLSQCALCAGEYRASHELSREAWDVDFPLGRHRASLLLGMSLGGAGMPDESRRAFSECVVRCDVLLDLCARHFDALLCRAAALLALGRDEEAESSYRAGLGICTAGGVRREAMLDLQMLAHITGDRGRIERMMSLIADTADKRPSPCVRREPEADGSRTDEA